MVRELQRKSRQQGAHLFREGGGEFKFPIVDGMVKTEDGGVERLAVEA